jgi:hypothetical protein
MWTFELRATGELIPVLDKVGLREQRLVVALGVEVALCAIVAWPPRVAP